MINCANTSQYSITNYWQAFGNESRYKEKSKEE